ncbi:MAG: GTP-binding protein [Myxococcota bacterium]|nr:GTP-binding protein [Myxococcota bacterium]
MKRYESQNIRSIALVGHSGCGKTSLGEAILYSAGANTRLGAVDDQTSLLDFEPEEHKRGGSISSSFGTVEWHGTKINVIDTPGDGNFIYDGRTAMLGADAAICVISAVDGVEVNTEKAWHFARDLGIPTAVFVNKMDRERANAAKAVEDVQEVMGVRAIPLQVSVGRMLALGALWQVPC